MDVLIKDMENVSLSNVDIQQLIDGKANILLYSELASYDNIDDILGPHGACVILYLTQKRYGHWVCIFKLGEDEVHFFDPYGLKIDGALMWKIPDHFRSISNEDFPHLSYLLMNSPYIVTYNNHRFQRKMKDVKTCGRHTAFRIIMRHLRPNEYTKLMTSSKYNPDQLVTMLTSFI